MGPSPANMAPPQVILERCDSSVIKILSILHSTASNYIVVASKSPNIRLFSGDSVSLFQGHTADIVSMVHLRGYMVASLDRNGTLIIWCMVTTKILEKIQVPGRRRDNLTKCDSGHLAIQTDEGQLQILNISYGDDNISPTVIMRSNPLKTLDETPVNKTVSQRSKLFAASSKCVEVWDFRNAEKLGEFEEAVDHIKCSDKYIFIAKRTEITIRENAGNFAVYRRYNLKEILKYSGRTLMRLAFLSTELLLVQANEHGMILVSMTSWNNIGQLESAISPLDGLPLEQFSAATILVDGKLCAGFSKGHCVIYKIANILNKTKKISVLQSPAIPNTHNQKQALNFPRPVQKAPFPQPPKRKPSAISSMDESSPTQKPKPKKRRLSMSLLEKEFKAELGLQNNRTKELEKKEQQQSRQLRMIEEQMDELKKVVCEKKSLNPRSYGVDHIDIEKILEDQRMNSEELIKEKGKQVAELEELKEKIGAIQKTILNLRENEESSETSKSAIEELKKLDLKTRKAEKSAETLNVNAQVEALSKDVKNLIVRINENGSVKSLEKQINENYKAERKRTNALVETGKFLNAEIEKMKVNMKLLMNERDDDSSENPVLADIKKETRELRTKLEEIAGRQDDADNGILEFTSVKSKVRRISLEIEAKINNKIAELNEIISNNDRDGGEETRRKIEELQQDKKELRTASDLLNTRINELHTEVKLLKTENLVKKENPNNNNNAKIANIDEDLQQLKLQVSQFMEFKDAKDDKNLIVGDQDELVKMKTRIDSMSDNIQEKERSKIKWELQVEKNIAEYETVKTAVEAMKVVVKDILYEVKIQESSRNRKE